MQNDLKNNWPAFKMYSQAARQSKVCVGNTNHEFNVHLWMWPNSYGLVIERTGYRVENRPQ